MTYTIGEVAEKLGITIHTLRYYDDQGLLPFVERSPNGRRIFKERDLMTLNTIKCLKATGLSLKDIKQYITWGAEGISTVPQRYQMFLERKKEVDRQIAELTRVMNTIEGKCKYYQTVLETGSLDVCEDERKALLQQILNND